LLRFVKEITNILGIPFKVFAKKLQGTQLQQKPNPHLHIMFWPTMNIKKIQTPLIFKKINKLQIWI
jgi:hypothetical protein